MCVTWQIRRLIKLVSGAWWNYDWLSDIRRFDWLRKNNGIIFVDDAMGRMWYDYGEETWNGWSTCSVSGGEGINGYTVQMALRLGITVVQVTEGVLPASCMPMMHVDSDTGEWDQDKPYEGILHDDYYETHRQLGIMHHGMQYVRPNTMLRYCLANGYKVLGKESLVDTVYGKYVGV